MSMTSGESKYGPDQPTLWESQLPISPRRQFIAALVMALASPIVFVIMWFSKPDYVEMLFTSSTGLRMLIYATVGQFIGMVVHFSWTFICCKKAHRCLTVLIAGLVFFMFYLPALFTVVVGPAAIAIYERLPPNMK